MVIKRLTNLVPYQGKTFKPQILILRSLPFFPLMVALLCDGWHSHFLFLLFLSHSCTLLFYSLWSLHFLQTHQISEWNGKKKLLMVLQGIKVWSGLSSGSSLKFALSRLIYFLISWNNTNSRSSSNWSRTKEIKCRSYFFLFRFDWNEAKITIHVLNILVPKQCCVQLTLDGCVNTVFIILLLFVCFSFSILNTQTSVCIFSILFSIHFLRCWQREFV